MGIYDFKAKRLAAGAEESLADFRGQVLLMVNVASHCGFTPQYKGLEALYRKYKDKGFSILGFPCNQFGAQESGTEMEIATFCSSTYDVTFPVFSKVEVNGPSAHPLYAYLKRAARGLFGSESIKWNFTKFLVDRDGRVVKRFGPQVKPEAIDAHIAKLL